MAEVPRSRRFLAATLACAVLAFAWSWLCGRRGFFPLDHSVVLDGAWRVASGQVPFRDFRAAFGLSAFALAGGWIALFGATFASFLACAATLNAIATVLVMAAVRRLGCSERLAVLAGVMTAAWFQPPFGLPYAEQTAFLFGFAGLAAVVAAAPRGCAVCWVIAGACPVVAVLAKQNAGGLLVPLLLVWCSLLTPAAKRRRALLWSAVGCGGAALLFAAWLVAFSSVEGFVEAWWRTPSGLLGKRLAQHFPDNLAWIVAGKGNWVARGGLLLCGAAALYAWLRLRRSGAGGGTPAVLALSLLLYQNLFNATSNARPEIGYPFAGMIVVLASCSLRGVLRESTNRVVLVLMVALMTGWGIWCGWSRRAHTALRGASFTARLDAPGWRTLRWGEPTRIRGKAVRAADVNGVLAHLRRRGGAFFVFPEFTALYAMLGAPSPQPLLWFHWGLTYPATYDARLDASIVDALRRNGVRTIVYETAAWMDADATLDVFPKLHAFVSEFREVATYGPFRVLER